MLLLIITLLPLIFVHYDGYINQSLVINKVSQSYMMTGEIIILYILFFFFFFKFSDSKQKDRSFSTEWKQAFPVFK